MRPFSLGMRHDFVAIQSHQHKYQNSKQLLQQKTKPRARCGWPQQQGYCCRCQTVAAYQSKSTVNRQRTIATQASSSSSALSPDDNQSPKDNKMVVVGGAVALAALVGVLIQTGQLEKIIALYKESAVTKSAFLASFTLVFLSEIGDKTFFICALLAAKLGSSVAFLGTMLALALMTIISVAIGVAFRAVPAAMHTSAPVGGILGAILLVIFALKSLQDGFKSQPESEEGEGSGELEEAEEAVQVAEQEGSLKEGGIVWKDIASVCGIIFVAEWGDRSMLATIALAAGQNPIGVALGGVMGHAIASVIAVVGGKFASKYISERAISIIGGICFLLFAVVTGFEVAGSWPV